MNTFVSFFSLERVSFWSQYAVYIFGGIALITGKVVNDRQAELILTLKKAATDAEIELEKLKDKQRPRVEKLQQKELTARMSGFKDQRGTIVASPSTPESVHFVMALTAALRLAGWDIEQLPPRPGTTVVFPTGVVISYRVTGRVPIDPQPQTDLAKALNEWGISATVGGGMLREGETINIIVSER